MLGTVDKPDPESGEAGQVDRSDGHDTLLHGRLDMSGIYSIFKASLINAFYCIACSNFEGSKRQSHRITVLLSIRAHID